MLVNTNTELVRKAYNVAYREERIAKYKLAHATTVLQAAENTDNTTLVALARYDWEQANAEWNSAMDRAFALAQDLRFATIASRSEVWCRINVWGERAALWLDTLGM
jgi:hypothetical protein